MKTTLRRHPTLGEYHLVDVPRRHVADDVPGASAMVRALIPAGSISPSDLAALLSPAGPRWGRLAPDAFLDIAYAQLVAEHDGSVPLEWSSGYPLPSAPLGLPDDISARTGWNGLALSLGESVYTLRSKGKSPLASRTAAAVSALRAAEARRTGALGADGIKPLEVDAVARWILANVVHEPLARSLAERLGREAAGVASAQSSTWEDPNVAINGIDLVGTPRGATIRIGRDRVVRGHLEVGDVAINASCVTTPGRTAAPVPPGGEARAVVDHPALDGLAVAHVRTSGKSAAVVHTLTRVAPERYDPTTVRHVPMDDDRVATMLAALEPPAGYDPIALHMLDGMDAANRLRVLHLTGQGRPDHTGEARRGGARFSRSRGRVSVQIALSKAACWRDDAVRIRDLPEAVMMRLIREAPGRPATDVVDHRALAGQRIRAAHRVAETEWVGGKHVDYWTVALHLEDARAAMAA